MSPRELTVPHRFCGPPSSGNGGWTAGSLAGRVPERRAHHAGSWPPIRVSLRLPPPLDTPMPVGEMDGATVASLNGDPVATAVATDEALTLVEPVTVTDARAAMTSFPGLTSHPFPTCFSCGVDRAEGDGLRIFPGRVADQGGATRVAATWTPHPSVAEPGNPDGDTAPRASLPTTWAALDCIGGWAGDLTERLMVLASMTARVEALPVIGAEHVVVGLARSREGRKTFTASALYDAQGGLVAQAEHLWIAIDPATFG